MAEEEKKNAAGTQDEARDKQKAEALTKVGPSKISQELKEKQLKLAQQRDASMRREGIINFLLLAIPVGVIIGSFFLPDKDFAFQVLVWGIIGLFTLLPAYGIIKALFFRKSGF